MPRLFERALPPEPLASSQNAIAEDACVHAMSTQTDDWLAIAAAWIPKGSALLDVGCGRAMQLEQLTSPREYIPVDSIAHDHRTVAVDLNRDAIPVEVLVKAEWGALFGVLEDLVAPEAFLIQLARYGLQVVCAYRLPERNGPDSQACADRSNAFSVETFKQLLSDSGFNVRELREHDKYIFALLEPIAIEDLVRRTAPTVSAIPMQSTIIASTGRVPRLVLSGFFGRGNAGDEALLHAQYEHFSRDFDIVISVERSGAFKGYWDWYPYNRCQLIGQEDLAIFWKDDVIGLHVGGGDLPIGFNAAQVIAARAAGKLVQMSGVDVGNSYTRPNAHLDGPDTHETYLAWTRPWVRSRDGFETLQRLNPVAQHGADWSLKLTTDRSNEVASGTCLLVLREFPENLLTSQVQRDLMHLVNTLQATYGAPIVLPFCPEDERMLSRLDAVRGLERQVHWWNPSRIKQWISQARVVVSVGRFHPLIFAASCGTPAYFSEWDIPAMGINKSQGKTKTLKAARLCKEIGIDYFSSMVALADAIQDPNRVDRKAHFDAEYCRRHDTMTQRVLSRFREAAHALAAK